MKKTLALILTLCAMLIPVSALELDGSEKTAVVSGNEAVLAEALEAPANDPTYGTPFFYFDGGDSGKDAYNAPGTTSYVMNAYTSNQNWSKEIVEFPAESGNRAMRLVSGGHSYLSLCYEYINTSDDYASIDVTTKFDIWLPAGVTPTFKYRYANGVDVTLDTGYNAETDSGKWFTVTVPKQTTSLKATKGQYYYFISVPSGTEFYIDNICIYAADTKTSNTVAEKPAEVDVSKGFLVYFNNGIVDEAYNSNIKLLGQSGCCSYDGKLAQGIFDCTSLMGRCDTHGLVAATTDGGAFKYADGTPFDGTVTLYADMYNGTSADAGYFVVSDNSSWESWGSYKTQWAHRATAAKKFSTVYGSASTNGITKIGFLRTAWDNHNAKFAFHSAYVYYMPNNRVTVDGILIDLTGKTEYTFGKLSDGYNAWSDGDKVYSAEQTVSVSEISQKTFKQIWYEKPVTDNQSENTVNGIRFKGSVTDKLRKNASEYGFLVARKSVLGKNDLTVKFTANGYRDAYVKGVAYDGTTDKFYEKTDDKISFAGVLTGVDLEDDYTYEVFAVRTYAMFKTAAGDIYAYGDTVTASYADEN